MASNLGQDDIAKLYKDLCNLTDLLLQEKHLSLLKIKRYARRMLYIHKQLEEKANEKVQE